MSGRFTGWPERAMDVLLHLQGEPSRVVREQYRADRERLVRQPMIALLNDVADADPRYEDFSVWHYRTNSWWWQHQGAVIRLGHKIEISLRFDLDGLRKALGGIPTLARSPRSARPSPPREAATNSPPSLRT